MYPNASDTPNTLEPKPRSLLRLVRAPVLAALAGLSLTIQAGPLPPPISVNDFYANANPPADQVELGKLLFWDKILSGNQDISCGTCHNPTSGTGDGLSLGLGTGSEGHGMMRTTIHLPPTDSRARGRIVRNALPLYNLGWEGFEVFQWDGDLIVDPSEPTGFVNPLGNSFPTGFQNPLAAHNFLPPAQPREMAGIDPANPIAALGLAQDMLGVWDAYTARLAAIPEYVDLFRSVYSDVNQGSDITVVHVTNSLAAYQIKHFTSVNSRFDTYLRGNRGALTGQERRGADLFYGKAGCDTCHSGPLLTDQDFHAISIPQIGPGRQFGFGGVDNGRMRNSGRLADQYKYRTPSLRNVALTAPYGHDGAYDTLEAVVRHHLNPVVSLNGYNTDEAVLPDSDRMGDLDFVEHNNAGARADRASQNELDPVALTARELRDLMSFLQTLTDPAMLDKRDAIPKRVPSGLPVFD
ncbi:cytochrome-c peroxidase [Alteromonas aestuariivivens]|uniref:Cytochrome-c peroxidase n=1 Tax=Alteromonas aestuariivivens TaxID=1938339 RepID=A0A3D8MBJ9_9ALTE|nr:cytochrome c peroxidase [Alteromonas aestuariivivens]RDV27511.1 cytochrome-c peroxidase [Alteromonas aestuariivivens]